MVDDIRESVRFINNSKGRLMKFYEILHPLDIHTKKLILDCPTGWNSTNEMLDATLKMRNVFFIFINREPTYHRCPIIRNERNWNM